MNDRGVHAEAIQSLQERREAHQRPKGRRTGTAGLAASPLHIAEHADRIAERVNRMPTILASVERHLIAEQVAAVTALADSASKPPDPDKVAAEVHESPTISHSDPTGNAAVRLAPFAAKSAKLKAALAALDKAVDHVDLTARACLGRAIDHDASNEPRCPGWNVDLRARLGGCGKHLEGYRRADGTTGLRDLCAGCRKAEQRANRAEAA